MKNYQRQRAEVFQNDQNFSPPEPRELSPSHDWRIFMNETTQPSIYEPPAEAWTISIDALDPQPATIVDLLSVDDDIEFTPGHVLSQPREVNW